MINTLDFLCREKNESLLGIIFLPRIPNNELDTIKVPKLYW